VALGEQPLLERCVPRVQVLAPEQAYTWYYTAIQATGEGRWGHASASLIHASELGLPESDARALRSAIPAEDPDRSAKLLAWGAVVVWTLSGMALLLVTWALSETVKDHATDSRPRTDALGVWVRRAYGAALRASIGACLLTPLALLTPLGVVVGISMGDETSVRPWALLALLALLASLFGWVALRVVAAQPTWIRPGMRLPLRNHARLRRLLREVGVRLGSIPVDRVYITPGMDLRIVVRGNALQHLTGRPQRCLVLGIALLDGLVVAQLKALIAHEYGHRAVGDTGGGAVALITRQLLVQFTTALSVGRWARAPDPARLLVLACARAFDPISFGAARMQERLADRGAARSYGSETLIRGLRNSIERQVRFEAHAAATLREVIGQGARLGNLYTYQPAAVLPDDAAKQLVKDAIHRTPALWDGHLSPRDRIKSLRALGSPGVARVAGDDDPAWSLFLDPERLQRDMTDRVRDHVRQSQGVTILPPES
jgi:Zn-dependent protease with chaperone function